MIACVQTFELYCICGIFLPCIGRGVFGQVWCGEAQCHREGGLWYSQAEERADGHLQAPSLPATRATWPARYGPGKNDQRVVHPNFSLSLHLWTTHSQSSTLSLSYKMGSKCNDYWLIIAQLISLCPPEYPLSMEILAVNGIDS